MSTLTEVHAVTEIARDSRWMVSDGDENQFFASSAWAAAWLVDEAMRNHLNGQTLELTVHLHDRLLGVLWDATSDVRDVFVATGWPKTGGNTLQLRATVIGIVKDILISDEGRTDAPEPGISDPQN